MTGAAPDPTDHGAPRLLGEGGEAHVYALDDDRVVRRWKAGRPSDQLADVLDILASAGLPFATPELLDLGCDAAGWYSIERRLPGRPLMDLLPTLTGQLRREALRSYARAAVSLGAVALPDPDFGPMFDPGARRPTWSLALGDLMDVAALECRATIAREVPELDEILVDVRRLVDDVAPIDAPSFVHGDFFPGNVLVSPDGSVSAVIDVGPLTSLAGDPRLDHVGAAEFLTVRPHHPDDPAIVRAAIAAELGLATDPQTADLYRLFYGLRLAPLAPPTSPMRRWCLRTLGTPHLDRDAIDRA